ncbi:UDP-glucuronosyltransferase 2B14-like [Lineus longissimus]|uniref:UDP-glucuronosyltransferase 2B14-like n=1 Tax=Lineus longissimus TaxID=88925 RepID=UPI00315CDB84
MEIIIRILIRYQQYAQYERYKTDWTDRPLTKSLSQLAAESQLWLIEQHPVLDFPRATYGNIKYIGGMNYKKSQPLTGKYAELADGATGGFIVVSLGADLLFLPKDLGDKMVAAFKKLPNYTFIWATKGELTEMPGNVFRTDWIPQNDLIGHKNCKLLITHCGNNGQFEAVGNGVPMLGIPIHRDQPPNAWRMKDKGFGLTVHLLTGTVDEIADKIKEVIMNPEYKNNVIKASKIFHDGAMTPTETAVYWVEHVLKHGTEYLKSDAMDMSWYQVLGYDIVAFLVLLVMIFIAVVKFTCSLIRNKMKGNKKTKND